MQNCRAWYELDAAAFVLEHFGRHSLRPTPDDRERLLTARASTVIEAISSNHPHVQLLREACRGQDIAFGAQVRSGAAARHFAQAASR